MNANPLLPQSMRASITLGVLSLLYFIGLAGTFNTLGMVLPAMVRELGWNWSEAGLGYTCLGLSCGLGSFVPAVLIRRIGVRATLVIGAGLLASGFAVLAMTHTLTAYLLATVSLGLGVAVAGTVPATYLLNDLFQKRSTALGIYFTAGALGGVAGPLIYLETTAATHGWRFHWVFFSAAAILAGLFAGAVTPKSDGASRKAAPAPAAIFRSAREWTVYQTLKTPQFYIIVGSYTTYLLVHTTAHSFAFAHLTERGMSGDLAGGMRSLEALIGALTAAVGGALGERIEPRRLLVASLTGTVVGMIALAYATSYPLLTVYAVGSGIGNGLSMVAAALLLLNYFGQRANLEIYSLMHTISTLACLGPLLGGFARDWSGSFTGTFLICAALTTAMGVTAATMRPPQGERNAEVDLSTGQAVAAAPVAGQQ